LLNAIPRLDIEQETLYNIPGVVPDPLHFPKGCKFNTRCRFKQARCEQEEPSIVEVEDKHFARCFYIEELEKAKKAAKAGEKA
jgi:peptide/nickel transport system ATP-binding protein